MCVCVRACVRGCVRVCVCASERACVCATTGGIRTGQRQWHHMCYGLCTMGNPAQAVYNFPVIVFRTPM